MRTSEEGEDTEARTPARLDVGSRIIFGLVGIGIVYMFLPAPLTVKTVVFSILNPNGIWFVIGAFAIWSGISGRNLVDFRRR